MAGVYIVAEPIGPIVVIIWGYGVDVDVLVPADVTIFFICRFGIRAEKASLAIYLWPALFKALPDMKSGDCP